MTRRVWSVVGSMLAVVLTTACTSSEVSSDDLDALRSDLSALNETVEELGARVDELEAAPPPTTAAPTTEPTGADDEAATDTTDLDEIVLRSSDLPDGWRSDPAGFGVLSIVPLADLLVTPCSLAPPPQLGEPDAAVEASFAEGGLDGAFLDVAVARFAEGRAMADAVDQMADETATCETFVEDPDGRTTVAPLDLQADGAVVAALSFDYEPNDPALSAFVTNGHNVAAQIGPYLIIINHADLETPDPEVTQAALTAMVDRAIAQFGSS